MRLTGNSAKGRHRVGQKLRRIALAAVAIGCLASGLAGAAAAIAPVSAHAATTMTLAQFVAKENGNYLDVDGVPTYKQDPVNGPYQCVDVFKAYDNWVVGSGIYPPPGGNGGADAYWTNTSLNNRYTHIAPTQAAQPGDVAVWGGGEDNLGHVAIVLNSAVGGATGNLYVLTQNPGKVHETTLGKTFTVTWTVSGQKKTAKASLLGFLRPKAPSTAPISSPTPATYHTGRQVKIAANATTGVSGHTGPGNTYAANTATGANQPLWIVCYVTGQSITNSYYKDTTTMWDLSDDGYYYSDAWLYTGTNGPAVPACHLKSVTVDKYATGGLSGHTGPGNNYKAGPLHGANTPMTIACYVTGQSITNSHYEDTTTIWDLAVGGYYYSDAWLYTGTNGAAVPHC
jgi:hypothetical protein